MSVLGAKTVVGVFESVPAAQELKDLLVSEGMPESRISVSANLTDDAIAAEAPGQSYENQPGQADNGRAARYGEAVRSGSCVVSVFARSDEESHYVEALMRAKRAYRTGVRP